MTLKHPMMTAERINFTGVFSRGPRNFTVAYPFKRRASLREKRKGKNAPEHNFTRYWNTGGAHVNPREKFRLPRGKDK